MSPKRKTSPCRPARTDKKNNRAVIFVLCLSGSHALNYLADYSTKKKKTFCVEGKAPAGGLLTTIVALQLTNVFSYHCLRWPPTIPTVIASLISQLAAFNTHTVIINERKLEKTSWMNFLTR